MSEHLLFLTGSLAEASLNQVLHDLAPSPISWEVRPLKVKVAALLTADMIKRQLPHTGNASRVVIPGRCRGDLQALSEHFGVPFQRGPDELRDLPEWLGESGQPVDLSQHDVLIFAEVVDAPNLTPAEILQRAERFRQDGADVIDLGGLPDQPFPHLAESVRLLKSAGFQVSVDSHREEELLTGGKAGADYLLSLTEQTLWIADEVDATPILIPGTEGDLDSLQRAWERLAVQGRHSYIDPILEPIHFGFTDSIVRYHEARRRLPDAAMMMGVGNLTELTEADTSGINALLFGIISELHVGAVLTTAVSPHCRSAIREADLSRRIMYRSRAELTLPKRLHGGLSNRHERNPFPYDSTEIRKAAEQVKDRNFRIQVNQDGIHIYNREGLHRATDPFDLFPHLGVEEDGSHAFYLGVELARAQVALQLGKRYTQDQLLDWGVATPAAEENLLEYAKPGSTKKHRKPVPRKAID
ncbi:DUF6513 domain-containing protein [Sedimenticola thiotaurini]|uniref:Dihydropteroate synthase n=1 Tax=Sedimenticola thiotaurini TaxID=1543721 RepID=A0A0F7JS12_9GAMM|nr:DUF6513 domain-containing protein [Sedimenticola thiotaurini]AKH19271.1 dihydropteroate synthase [Sedimenticola thiotaurini]